MTIEQEVLRVERELFLLPDPGALAKRIAALEQSLMMSWTYAAVGTTAPPTPNTTITGQVRGCANASLGNAATIVVQDAGTLATLGTATASGAGAYSVSIFLASNTSCLITATVTGAQAHRYAAGTLTSTIASGATNVSRNVTCGPATGYTCLANCVQPWNNTINCHDNHYAVDVTLTWDGVSAWVGSSGGRDYKLAASGGFTPGIGGTFYLTSGGSACSPFTKTFASTTNATWTFGDQFVFTDGS